VGDAHFVFNQDGIAEFPKHLLPLFELLQLHQPNQFELVVDEVTAPEQEAPEQEAVVDEVVVSDETAQSDAAPKSKKGK
jgi:hypothetical protein